MYARRLNGKTLSFGHAGILYRNSFVMYDRETGSLWVHVTGRAEHGPRKGWQLDFVPSTVTTWAQWKQAHPDSRVLPGHRRGGFMGTYVGTTRPEGVGLSVLVGFEGKLYPFEALAERPVVNDVHRDEPVLVVYDRQHGSARAWSRAVNGRTLTFEAGPPGPSGAFSLVDRETGSTWSWLAGRALAGALEGEELRHVSHHPILNRRFHGFYPDGPVYE